MENSYNRGNKQGNSSLHRVCLCVLAKQAKTQVNFSSTSDVFDNFLCTSFFAQNNITNFKTSIWFWTLCYCVIVNAHITYTCFA